MKSSVIWLSILLVSFSVHTASAEDPALDLQAVVKKVQSVYSRHCCFKAKFDQLTVNTAMDMKDRFLGTMYVKKPGMISLIVKSPEPQRVVIQGRQYSVFFPADGNASSGEIPQELNVEQFFGFFANIGEIQKNFSVSAPARNEEHDESLIFLELADLKHPNSTYTILLGIDKKEYTVRRAVIYDALANYNRFDLSEITFVDSLPESTFQLLPESKQGFETLTPEHAPK
jgi:outer membrane lipoprotein-sorting protein